jgi:hypothetical protein
MKNTKCLLDLNHIILSNKYGYYDSWINQKCI